MPAAITTTFKPPMSASVSPLAATVRRVAIIAVTVASAVAVAGCGIATRWAYDHGGWFAYRWADGFVGFDEAQGRRVRALLDEWFAWHRRTQLPAYVAVLARARAQVLADTTPQAVCAWNAELQSQFAPAIDRALPGLAEVALTLTPQQLERIEAKNAERNEEYRREHLHPDPERRLHESLKRALERAEEIYGRLHRAQREMLIRTIPQSPFLPEAAYADRIRRQDDTVATLRRLQQPGTTRAEAERALRALVDRLQRDRDPERAARTAAWSCEWLANLHNSATRSQREYAARVIERWEKDFRRLAGEEPADGG